MEIISPPIVVGPILLHKTTIGEMLKNNRISKKEAGLIKGALRRVFSRSELRKQALLNCSINHFDFNKPRVTKWNFCPIEDCGLIFPAYLAEVDHCLPVVPLDKSLYDLTAQDLVDNLWCDINNLRPLCSACHKAKTKQENKERREWRKKQKNQS